MDFWDAIVKNALSKDSRLIILNHPLIIPERRVQVNCATMLGGRYRLQTRKARSGSLQKDTGWFNNLITNIGLNQVAVGPLHPAFYIGAGTTAPAATDVNMVSHLGTSTSLLSSTNGNQVTTPPYYGWNITQRQFLAGTGTGVIAEVGCGWNSNPNGSLYSRALVLDSGGAPTTIVKASDEILTVAYEHRMYMPMTDSDSSFTVTGSGVHSTKTRAAKANGTDWNGDTLLQAGHIVAGSCAAYTTDIGAITSNPTGTASGITSSLSAYVPGSMQRAHVLDASIGQANISIRSILVSNRLGAFQTRLDPVLTKNSSQTLKLTTMWSWGRASI